MMQISQFFGDFAQKPHDIYQCEYEKYQPKISEILLLRIDTYNISLASYTFIKIK